MSITENTPKQEQLLKHAKQNNKEQPNKEAGKQTKKLTNKQTNTHGRNAAMVDPHIKEEDKQNKTKK
jgi:hypothetical protein